MSAPHDGNKPQGLAPYQERWKWVGEQVALGRSVDEVVAAVRQACAYGATPPPWAYKEDKRGNLRLISVDQLERRVLTDYRRQATRAQAFDRLAQAAEAMTPWACAQAMATDLLVYAALLKRVKDSGLPVPEIGGSPIEVSISQRDLLIGAGIGCKETLRRSVDRLSVAGLAAALPRESILDTTTYVVGAPGGLPTTCLYGEGNGSNSVVSEDLSRSEEGAQSSLEQRLHILWTNVGLGANARRLWFLLDEVGPVSATVLAESLGLSVNAARKLLRRLRDLGLASKIKGRNGGWLKRLTAPADLDLIAESVGVIGWRAAMAARCEHEREDYEHLLAARLRYGSPLRSADPLTIRYDHGSGALPAPSSHVEARSGTCSQSAPICPYFAARAPGVVAVELGRFSPRRGARTHPCDDMALAA